MAVYKLSEQAKVDVDGIHEYTIPIACIHEFDYSTSGVSSSRLMLPIRLFTNGCDIGTCGSDANALWQVNVNDLLSHARCAGCKFLLPVLRIAQCNCPL